MNVADGDPAGTVILGSTEAGKLVHCRDTIIPPVRAGAVSVTVPLLIRPPVTDVGLRAYEARTIGTTVRLAVVLTPPAFAVRVTGVDFVTTTVLTVKGADVFPAVTVTLGGTVATAVLELVSVTTVPPVGAGPLRVTVAVDGKPPITLGGLMASDASNGFTVRAAFWMTPPADAVIVTD